MAQLIKLRHLFVLKLVRFLAAPSLGIKLETGSQVFPTLSHRTSTYVTALQTPEMHSPGGWKRKFAQPRRAGPSSFTINISTLERSPPMFARMLAFPVRMEKKEEFVALFKTRSCRSSKNSPAFSRSFPCSLRPRTRK